MIYISFDVDSMDAGLAWGTGTPVANGLSGFQAKQLLTGLLKDPRISCLELAEINPLLDVENQIARLTFPILKASVEQMQETSLLSKV
jgi:arginase